MTRHLIAARLSLVVALAGLLPIATVGIISVNVLRRRLESAAQHSLKAVSVQAAGRVAEFLSHQRQLMRTIAAIAAGPQGSRQLEDVVLDAPSLGRVTLVGKESPPSDCPRSLSPQALSRVFQGKEESSGVYLGPDSIPAMDICLPAPASNQRAICAQLDLLEFWRFLQRIHIGTSGYALAFDERGRLIASGAGSLRGAILTGARVPETPYALAAAADEASAPTRYVGADGEPVIAGWARLPKEGWTIVLEQPEREALRSAQTAQWVLASVLLLALLLSVSVGLWQSHRLLGELEIEERWRTAGRIASGIAHDLGHRLRVLEQTAELAGAANPDFFPRIRDNLRSEVMTLKKFVADFSHLSRNMQTLDMLPLELGAFLQSIRHTAKAYADEAGIRIETRPTDGALWVNADRYLMERAVLNLVSNAIEASAPASIVQLSARRQEAVCEIEVSDRGSGIAPARLPHLFDTFSSTKRAGLHLGMGLPNVKRIVEAHSGGISVESRPGLGTTFRIRLPAGTPPPRPA